MMYNMKGTYIGQYGIYNTNPVKKAHPLCTVTLTYTIEGADEPIVETFKAYAKNCKYLRQKADTRAHVVSKRYEATNINIEEKEEWI